MLSTRLPILFVIYTLALGGLLIAGLVYAAMTHARTRGQDARFVAGVSTLTGAVVLAWLAMVFVLSATGAYATNPDTRMPWLALGIAIPILLGSWLLAFAPFRALLERIPLPWLVGVQLYRAGGVVVLVAYSQRLMPAEFAIPAGLGDMLVGLTAPIAAYSLWKEANRSRALAVMWNVLGIADYVLAVTLGFLTSPSVYQQLALDAPNTVISRYPFVLVPTFAIPVSILLHIYTLWRLRRKFS